MFKNLAKFFAGFAGVCLWAYLMFGWVPVWISAKSTALVVLALVTVFLLVMVPVVAAYTWVHKLKAAPKSN